MKVTLNVYGESYDVVITAKPSNKRRSSKSSAYAVKTWLEAMLWELKHNYPERGLHYKEVCSNAHNFHNAEF